jgi:hypothetical protein
MSTTVIKAIKTANFIEFTICPNYDDGCKCEGEAVFAPHLETYVITAASVIPHPVYKFSAQPPTWQNAKGREVEFKGDWERHCLNEALMLVELAHTEEAPESLDHLVGKKLNDD